MDFIHSQFSDYSCEDISFYTTFKSRPFEFLVLAVWTKLK